jgi:hypothetical protein
MAMQVDQITGVLRAVVPAAVAFAVGSGWISEGASGEVIAAVTAVGAAAWAVWKNRAEQKIIDVAAMPGTVVTSPARGQTAQIAVIDKDLARAAKEAATGADGRGQ